MSGMTDIASLLQQGSTNLWLFVPSAILLGALHGLEPGHSKTMMAAFIIAVRGTVAQAVLLGVSATISHTAIVWIIALLGLHFGSAYNTEAIEPYLQLVSGVLIVLVAIWMMTQTWHHSHHSHSHANKNHHGHNHNHTHDHHHDHTHAHDDLQNHSHLDLGPIEDMDDHQRQHALEIQQRFANRTVTTGQIIMFGLTGGLIPCPASVTVLLICLQLKQITMGVVLVLCFSIGLALTMVGVGAVAALSLNRASKTWGGFDSIAQKAPYLSGALITLVGIYTAYLGYIGLGM
jgi:ABC-type nickel/cobalt efflux system permease component RcnA